MASNNGNNKSAEEVARTQAFNIYCAYTLGATPVDRHDLDKVNSRIYAFFEACATNGFVANVVALSLALGIAKDTLYNWRNGRTKDLAPGVSDSIKNACQIIESNTLTNAQVGAINPIAAALVLNNNFGYANNTQQVNIEVKAQQSANQIADKYKNIALECSSETENDK